MTDTPPPPPPSLAYRAPADEARPVSGRDVFRMVRWSAYGTFSLAVAGLLGFFLVTGATAEGLDVTLVLTLIVAAFLALTALSAYMVYRTWRRDDAGPRPRAG